ncbi:hypothetical protein V1290_002849 [Bradyrhizobium sp. AZCC 1578]
MTAPDAIAIVADTYARPMLAARAGDLTWTRKKALLKHSVWDCRFPSTPFAPVARTVHD